MKTATKKLHRKNLQHIFRDPTFCFETQELNYFLIFITTFNENANV